MLPTPLRTPTDGSKPPAPSSPPWLGNTRARRGLAASLLVLSAGGLFLLRQPASAHREDGTSRFAPAPFASDGKEGTAVQSAAIAGPGAHGVVALSHGDVLVGRTESVIAEVRLAADAREQGAEHGRAPLAIAVVLDTSGSMAGEKMEQARAAVARLLGDMRDDDEVALVRYATDAEVLQPRARVGDVRGDVARALAGLTASGGTEIPRGLRAGLRALDGPPPGAGLHPGLRGDPGDEARSLPGDEDLGRAPRPLRVQRVVLVSDGLDGTRREAERLAEEAFGRGVTLSTLGIGLDFDAAYMGGVARAGHGNFGFVKDASALAGFLRRELEEAAGTTVEDATVRLALPPGLSFVRAQGGAATVRDGVVEIRLGALFAGDERRALVELSARLEPGASVNIAPHASWKRVVASPDARAVEVTVQQLTLSATHDPQKAARSRDPGVLASWASVTASERQLEATEAYGRGDSVEAERLIAHNVAALSVARAAAPPAAAAALARQRDEYAATKDAFVAAPPFSEEGKTAAKSSAEKGAWNLARARY